MPKIYQINIHDKSDNLFAFYSTKNKNEVDRLVKKFLRVKGVSVEVKIIGEWTYRIGSLDYLFYLGLPPIVQVRQSALLEIKSATYN